MYSQILMEHFAHPRNVGEIPDPDGVGVEGNPICGDIMKMYIKVDQGVIKDIKFQTFGCGAAIATSSMVTEMVKGKRLEEAMQVTNRMVAEALGGLPPIKMHCSNLAADALHRAIDDYHKRLGEWPSMGEGLQGQGRCEVKEGRPCPYCSQPLEPQETVCKGCGRTPDSSLGEGGEL